MLAVGEKGVPSEDERIPEWQLPVAHGSYDKPLPDVILQNQIAKERILHTINMLGRSGALKRLESVENVGR